MKRLIVVVIMVLVLSSVVHAQAIAIPDPFLRMAVEGELGRPATATSMLALTVLNAENLGISSLQGLEWAHNLDTLALSDNQIIDLSPLAELTNLLEFYLNSNQISDISPLADLTSLYWLFLNNNQISDISWLVRLTNLRNLGLQGNPLQSDACNIYIHQLEANGTNVDYDPCVVLPFEKEVPYVVGWSQSAAQQVLEDEGFTVAIVNASSETVPAEHVISQDPIAGTTVPIFDPMVVTLTISTGPAGPGPRPETVAVPRVVGMLQMHAEQELTSAGLTVAIVNAPSETVPAEHVISQDPVGGTQVAVGSAVTLTISTGPGGPGPGPDLPAPVAHWALDETAGLTAFDSAGSHDGRLYGNPTWQPDGGIIDSALRFDGVDDYVDCGTFNPSAATGKLTVCLWAKWNGLTEQFQGLIGKRDTWDAGQMMWQLEASRDHGIVGFFRNGSGRNDGFLMPVGQWVHIAATCDGTTSRLYLDGQQVVSSPMTFGSDTAAALVFGACEKNGGNPFNGMLDDVQLYDQVLNAQQIQAVMAEYPNTLGTSGPDQGGLVAHYAFEGNAEDSAGGHQGDVYGATWTQGMTGLALRLDGDDYVEVADDTDFDMTEAVSVAAWVNLEATPNDWDGIVTKGDSTWRLSMLFGAQRFHFGINDQPGSYHTVDCVTYSPLNEWHYVVGTFDGALIRLYVDGVEDPASPAAYTGSIHTDDYPVWIGANSQIWGRNFVGRIDEAMIYDRALSQIEILSLMAQTD